MRRLHSTRNSVASDISELQFFEFNDSLHPSEFTNQNLLDQGFILYSDDEIMSVASSIPSSLSLESRSIIMTRRSRSKEQPNIHRNAQYVHNVLNNFTNEESSICDVRESQCSQSGKQLLLALEPLFKDKFFRRRSPRFVTYGEVEKQSRLSSRVEKPYIFENIDLNKPQQASLMTLDDKSPSNQITQILQEKQEEEILSNNKLYTFKPEMTDTIECSSRVTRSSSKISDYSTKNTSIIQEREKLGDEKANQILSKITKDYIVTTRKQKKRKDKNARPVKNQNITI